MAKIKLKGFKFYKDRHGKQRCYHRKSGTKIDLVAYPLETASFYAECERVVESYKQTETKPFTLGGLFKEYRLSYHFQNELSDRSQRDYIQKMEMKELMRIYDMSLHLFTAPLIIQIRDAIAQHYNWRQANYVHSVMSVAFSFGVERGIMERNTCLGIKKLRRPKGLDDPNRPWTIDECRAVLTELPNDRVKAVIAVGLFTGLRKGDLLALKKHNLNSNMITTKTSKTGEAIEVELPEWLADAVTSLISDRTDSLFSSSTGNGWTNRGFGHAWERSRKILLEQGKIGEGLTIHGLRHTIGSIATEGGLNIRAIADMLTHSTTQMTEHYTKKATKSGNVKLVSNAVSDALNLSNFSKKASNQERATNS